MTDSFVLYCLPLTQNIYNENMLTTLKWRLTILKFNKQHIISAKLRCHLSYILNLSALFVLNNLTHSLSNNENTFY